MRLVMMMRFPSVLACTLVLFACIVGSSHAYTTLGIEVDLSIQEDGTAHVKERYALLLESDAEIETFENYRTLGQNTIIEWRRFVNELKYHITSRVTPANTKISARRLLELGRRSVVLELEYDINSPVVTTQKLASRTTLYTLTPSVLSFDTTATGETVLPNVASLVIDVPPSARIQAGNISPDPARIAGNQVVWVGPLTSRWRFSYTMEETLSDEVSMFFTDMYDQAANLIPLLLPIGLLVLVAGFIYSKFGRSH